jgi:hypothetical protein
MRRPRRAPGDASQFVHAPSMRARHRSSGPASPPCGQPGLWTTQPVDDPAECAPGTLPGTCFSSSFRFALDSAATRSAARNEGRTGTDRGAHSGAHTGAHRGDLWRGQRAA